ncbi:hypothetical protein AB5J72_15150 [Streptomyces sp. CG1]|uniref:hypothetical protein n=1 Tax=Streptomyces sp. CG1 TaxID=1287523 RepID=UPI0034E28519
MHSARTQAGTTERTRRAPATRGPWAALCAAATVVLGPAAATASALGQANAAPLHHAVRAEQGQACRPADATRGRTAG